MVEYQFQEWYKDQIIPSDEELNELEHYGIKGMKWGVQNGPPYPLDDDVSKRVRQAGKEKRSKKKEASENEVISKNKLHLTSTQKKLIIAGTAAAATGLAIYGAYKLGALDKLKATTKYGSIVDPITGLKRKAEAMSREKDLKLVNPGFPKKKGSTINCTHCVTAYELRRRGYDVQATPAETTKNFSIFGDYFNQYVTETSKSTRNPGESEIDFRTRAIANLEKKLRSYGSGARGVIGAHQISLITGYSGHVFSWEVVGDKVRFMDAQQGLADARSLLESDTFIPDRYDYARLDDLPLKLGDFTKIVKNRK